MKHQINPALMLAISYIAIIIFICLHPFIFHFNFNKPIFAPIIEAVNKPHILRDIVQNFVFYVPLGAFYYLAYQKAGFWKNLLKISALCLLLSISIEVLQNFVESRTPSGLDIILNFLGAVCAYFILGLLDFALFKKQLKPKFNALFASKYFYISFILTLAWSVYFIWPIIPNFNPKVLSQSYLDFYHNLHARSLNPQILQQQLLILIPGFVAYMCLLRQKAPILLSSLCILFLIGIASLSQSSLEVETAYAFILSIGGFLLIKRLVFFIFGKV